jgi:hypothetical protein
MKSGTHGALTVEEAREQVKGVLGDARAAARRKSGAPNRASMLCGCWHAPGVGAAKPNT